MYISYYCLYKFRKYKGDIKIHTFYNIENQTPTFFYVTNAKVNDVNAIDVISYEIGSYYVFDRGYNDFKRLYKIRTLDFLLSDRRKTFNISVLNVNADFLRTYCLMQRLN